MSIFLQDISFLSIEDYKDTITTTLSDDEIQALIYRAEQAIKNYLGYPIEKTDDNEQDLKEATYYVSRQLEVNKDTIKKANTNGSLKGESTGDRSYTLGDMTKMDIEKISGINTEAKMILDKYKRIFFSPVI